MAPSDLTRARYAGYDFFTVLDDLRTTVQTKYASSYNDFALASLGMMLLDVTSFGIEGLSFYLDRRATESYLSTARTRAGIARLSRQLGYKIRGAVSSSTDLTVSVALPKSFTVSILPGFQFQGPNNLVFEAAKQVDWSPAEQSVGTEKLVPVYQGSTVRETFKSDGTANQAFELHRVPEDQYAADGSVEVLVDGVQWEEQDFLYYSASNQYEVEYTSDPVVVRFGDGTAGNIPVTGASIEVQYVATSGRSGSVAKETIQDVVTPLVIVGESVQLSVDNLQKSGGGDGPEANSRVKSLAGRVYSSRRRAITGPDYEALAQAFSSPIYGRVAVAKAISSRSAEEDIELQSELLQARSALYGATTILRAEIATATGASGTLPQADTALASIDTTLDDCVTSLSTLATNLAAVVAGIRADRNLTLDIDVQATAAQADVVLGKAAVDSSSATPGEKIAIKAFFTTISSCLTAISATTTTLRSSMDSQVAAAGVVSDELDKLGTSRTALQIGGRPSYMKQLSDDQATLVLIVGTYDSTTPSNSTGLYRTFGYVLEDEVADEIDPMMANNSATSVFTALAAIYDHVDALLSVDCKANLISIPILVRDAAGFYTEPSMGLVAELNTYLEARKEVTQNPRVVSGGGFLVFPWLQIRAGFHRGYSLEQGRTAIEAAVDNVLRDRGFGVNLYESDLSKPIESIDGVAFVNVDILGYTTTAWTSLQTDKLDAQGNLVILTSEVVTKTPDSVEISVEAYVPPA